MPGRVVIQWDKEDCADLGIIKIDLLGLGMLAVLEEAIPLMRAQRRRRSRSRPSAGRRSRGVRDARAGRHRRRLPGREPRADGDAAADEAAHVLRPGGRGRDHPARADRRQDGPSLSRPAQRPRAGDLCHPSLEPILRRTLGVPLFQEQLLRMAMTVAGFSGGEAEELRRAMGFKRSAARMEKIERRLREGMARNGITGATADEIVRSITSFALYGFPESHAASFALIAYASAYLKCHHPAAFFAAMLNCYPLGFYHPSTLVKDAAAPRRGDGADRCERARTGAARFQGPRPLREKRVRAPSLCASVSSTLQGCARKPARESNASATSVHSLRSPTSPRARRPTAASSTRWPTPEPLRRSG